MRTTFTIIALVAVISPAFSQQLTSRSQLNTILAGGSSATDNFETYSVFAGSATTIGTGTLDSTTVANGQGPGLVNPGVTYGTAGGFSGVQWDGAGYYGSPSQEILTDGGPEIDISYASANAMGVDIRDFAGYGQPFTATVWDGGTELGSFSSSTTSDGLPQFFGWYNAAGITEVQLVNTSNASWSPIIDNDTFGMSSVPEPFSMVGLGLAGLVALKRRRR